MESTTPVWIGAAFVFGFLARRIGLPPLVGFLIGGFVLDGFGVEPGADLEAIADVGVTLLLFSIGLKLKPATLLRPEVWGTATLHMGATVLVLGGAVFGLSLLSFTDFAALDLPAALLIAFGLSFSSTVFAVKALEEKGESGSLHGRVSVGILIIQDLFAVVLLTASKGSLPSAWALVIPPALLVLRPILMRALDRSGHGELLILFGIILATFVGWTGFEVVGLKGDLGALVVGMLLAAHPKAGELSRSLLSLKDLFLVGFFLQIGFAGDPDAKSIGIASILVITVLFKAWLFFFLLSRFRLRARTAFFSTLTLGNLSEFGLIVIAVGVKKDWIHADWLVNLAIAVSITFIVASPLNSAAHRIYGRLKDVLARYETKKRHPEEIEIDPGDAEIFVIGMGSVGVGAYEAMRERFGDRVIGLDYNADTIAEQREAGRNVIHGDATDPRFWERVRRRPVRLVMLALRKHAENLTAVKLIRKAGYPGLLAATARFDDELEELRAAGAVATFNLYAEAGVGFADHVCEALAEEEGCRAEDPSTE